MVSQVRGCRFYGTTGSGSLAWVLLDREGGGELGYLDQHYLLVRRSRLLQSNTDWLLRLLKSLVWRCHKLYHFGSSFTE